MPARDLVGRLQLDSLQGCAASQLSLDRLYVARSGSHVQRRAPAAALLQEVKNA